MLLIYTHKITPRFSYVMRQVFTRILGIEVSYTTKVEDFIKHSGAKITYTKQPLQNEFFVRSNDLLFEQGINDIQINVAIGKAHLVFLRPVKTVQFLLTSFQLVFICFRGMRSIFRM